VLGAIALVLARALTGMDPRARGGTPSPEPTST